LAAGSAAGDRRHRRGAAVRPAAPWSAAKRRKCRACTATATTTSRASPWRGRARLAAPRDVLPRRTRCWAWRVPASIPTLLPGAAHRGANRPALDRACPIRSWGDPGTGADGPPRGLREVRFGAAPGRVAEGGGGHITGGGLPATSPACCPTHGSPRWNQLDGAAVFRLLACAGEVPSPKCSASSTADWAWSWSSPIQRPPF